MKNPKMTNTGYNKSTRSRSSSKFNVMDEDDEEDDEDGFVPVKRNKPKTKQVENELEVFGEKVSIKSLRPSVYHDDRGNRIYGSWQ